MIRNANHETCALLLVLAAVVANGRPTTCGSADQSYVLSVLSRFNSNFIKVCYLSKNSDFNYLTAISIITVIFRSLGSFANRTLVLINEV